MMDVLTPTEKIYAVCAGVMLALGVARFIGEFVSEWRAGSGKGKR